MIELFCTLFKNAPKKIVKIVAEKPAIAVGVTSLIATGITGWVKSKCIQEGYISSIKRYNNYGSLNGGTVQYLEETDSDTDVRDKKHPEFRRRAEEGCRQNELELNLRKSKEEK